MATVGKSAFEDVLKFGMYSLDVEDDYVFVCNLCGEEFELIADVLFHIVNEHMDDELPDVDPAGEDVGCVD